MPGFLVSQKSVIQKEDPYWILSFGFEIGSSLQIFIDTKALDETSFTSSFIRCFFLDLFGDHMKKEVKIKGIHCKNCKILIEDILGDINVKASVNIDTKSAIIDFDEKKISIQDIAKELKIEGYGIK